MSFKKLFVRFSPVFLMINAIIVVAANHNGDSIKSIVKVFSVNSSPNYYQPWQNYQQESSTGSGCIISGNRILTNAHIVANQTFLMVQKQGDPKKYIAKLIVAGHECDLALLKVEDPKFFKNMPPLEFGELPQLQDTVSVMGYPMGGDNISITEGVVSRIEPTLYSHSGRHLLSVQIDAAINPGNSGGPVMEEGKIVGIAFQGLSSAENMGFMIPSPVVKHFLKDVEDGVFDGFPDIDIDISKMENPDLRTWAKMSKDQTGVLITKVVGPEKKKGIFKVNDVILSIDGVKIANNATVPFRNDEVIFFGNLIWEKYIGEHSKIRILRDGKPIDIDYKLGRIEKLVPVRNFDAFPIYYIMGGLLFIPLSQNYLDSWGNWWGKAPRSLSHYATKGEITDKVKEVVVLSEVLADDVNVGYQGIKYTAIKTVNGKPLKNLKELIKIIENPENEYLVMTLDNNQKVVLDLKKARNATPTILQRYRIPTDRSSNLISK